MGKSDYAIRIVGTWAPGSRARLVRRGNREPRRTRLPANLTAGYETAPTGGAEYADRTAFMYGFEPQIYAAPEDQYECQGGPG
jgi:hypothetical protein